MTTAQNDLTLAARPTVPNLASARHLQLRLLNDDLKPPSDFAGLQDNDNSPLDGNLPSGGDSLSEQ